MIARILMAVLVAGWLADTLATRDRDIEAGIDAFEDGRLDDALDHYRAAEQRLGERPELHFNIGLVELARGNTEESRTAFHHASESDDASIRASAHYQLGNVSFDNEDYDAAITDYVEALKAKPEHHGAKWNLELALQRKRDQEEKQEEQPEPDEQQDTDGEPQDQGETDNEPEEQDDTDGEQPPQDQSETGEPPPSEDDPADQQAQPQPQAMDQVDIDKALEQLDAEDQFTLGKPMGRVPVPDKDW